MDNQKEKSKKASRIILIGCLSPILFIIIIGIVVASCTNNKKEVNYSKLNNENLTAAINNSVGDTGHDNKKRVIKTKVDSSNYVMLRLNADASTDAKKILYDTNDVMKELKKFKNAKQITIWWYETAIDDKGNKSEIPVVKVSMDRDSMDDIDFENFPIESYEKYSKDYFVHPSWSIK